jgi:hypothetical protein
MSSWREVIIYLADFPLIGLAGIIKHRETDPDDPATERHWFKTLLIPVGSLVIMAVLSGGLSSMVVLSVLESKLVEIVKINDQQTAETIRQSEIAAHSRENVQNQIYTLEHTKKDK